MMKAEVLATAALLTAVIGFTMPAKADTTQDQLIIHSSLTTIASANLLQLEPSTPSNELKVVSYAPYQFEKVHGAVILSHQDGIACLVSDHEETASDGTVMCGLIDKE